MKRVLYLKSAVNKRIACLLLGHRLPGDEKVVIRIRTYSDSITSVHQGAGRIEDYRGGASALELLLFALLIHNALTRLHMIVNQISTLIAVLHTLQNKHPTLIIILACTCL